MFDKETAKQIWEAYKRRVSLQVTARSGFGRCGIYPLTKYYDAGRPESVAEHTSTVSMLMVEVLVHYPELFSYSNYWPAVMLMIYHDAAEYRLGDIPDNGERDEMSKDEREFQIMRDVILRDWPERPKKQLLKVFGQLQRKSTRLGCLAFTLDKIDAPLRALVYEAEGHPGSVFNDPHVTEMDRDYAALTGDGSTPDVWGYHALDRFGDSEFSELAYLLLIAAFEDVRGQAPAWLNRRYYDYTQKK